MKTRVNSVYGYCFYCLIVLLPNIKSRFEYIFIYSSMYNTE